MTRVSAAVIAGFLLFSQHSLTAAGPARVERVLYLMGTRVTLTVEEEDRISAMRQLERMVLSLEETEADLSTWRAESFLTAVNRQPVGQTLGLPSALCSLWPELNSWYRATGGAFDPAVGALSEIWGLRNGGSRPTTSQIDAARTLTGLEHFEFDRAACMVTRLVNVTLDAGAFGKGEALRRLLRQDAWSGPWMVDLGGQIAVSRELPTGAWPIAIAHPTRRVETALEIILDGGSLATSGASERSRDVEGGVVSHIFDPRTGRPLYRPESVTVWHEDALAADILSTALYVLGPGEGLRYANERGFAALFLVPIGVGDQEAVTFLASPAFRERFPGRYSVDDWRAW